MVKWWLYDHWNSLPCNQILNQSSSTRLTNLTNIKVWLTNIKVLTANIILWSTNIKIWSTNIKIWSTNIKIWRTNLEIWSTKCDWHFPTCKRGWKNGTSRPTLINHQWYEYDFLQANKYRCHFPLLSHQTCMTPTFSIWASPISSDLWPPSSSLISNMIWCCFFLAKL